MNFSITDGISNLGAVAIVVLISAALIVLVFLFGLTRQVRHDVIEQDADHEGPEL